jgi:FkbM family methyltransferase
MIKAVVRKIADAFGYAILKRSQVGSPIEYPFLNSLELILQNYLQHNPDLVFMQIGSHDGSSADPICHLVQQYHWRGLLVEPQPAVFEQLKQTYQHEPQLIFENALIGYEDGLATLYTIRDDNSSLPFWLSQSASLNREIVKSTLCYWKQTRKLEAIPDDYESLIEEVLLPSITVKTVLSKHNIAGVDLLIIDTMGFDFEILKMFPFETCKPAIIHFEHLMMPVADQQACFQFLANLGYGLTQVAQDTIAYLYAPIRTGPYIAYGG